MDKQRGLGNLRMRQRLVVTAGCLLAMLSVSCKRMTGGTFGSAADDGEGFPTASESPDGSRPSHPSKIRGLAGQLDFDLTSPSAGPGTQSPRAVVTVKMEFGIALDETVGSLQELTANPRPFRKVGSLTTFNIAQEPGEARAVSEEIGRPLYQVVKPECAENCLRFITGGGRVSDPTQVILLEFRSVKDQWVLKGFNYFGNKVTEFGLPVRLIATDRFDGEGP